MTDDTLTFGKLTFGTMTECSALGAFFGAALGSPPGWYWYLKLPLAEFPFDSTCQGIVPSAMLTGASEDEEVGFRPIRPVLMQFQVDLRGRYTEMPPHQRKGTGHDG